MCNGCLQISLVSRHRYTVYEEENEKRKKGLKSKRIEDVFVIVELSNRKSLNLLFWLYRYWRPMGERKEMTKFKTVSSIWNAICLFCGFQSAIHTMLRIKWHQTRFHLMDFNKVPLVYLCHAMPCVSTCECVA